jgi:hypothetical protein
MGPAQSQWNVYALWVCLTYFVFPCMEYPWSNVCVISVSLLARNENPHTVGPPATKPPLLHLATDVLFALISSLVWSTDLPFPPTDLPTDRCCINDPALWRATNMQIFDGLGFDTALSVCIAPGLHIWRACLALQKCVDVFCSFSQRSPFVKSDATVLEANPSPTAPPPSWRNHEWLSF